MHFSLSLASFQNTIPPAFLTPTLQLLQCCSTSNQFRTYFRLLFTTQIFAPDIDEHFNFEKPIHKLFDGISLPIFFCRIAIAISTYGELPTLKECYFFFYLALCLNCSKACFSASIPNYFRIFLFKWSIYFGRVLDRTRLRTHSYHGLAKGPIKLHDKENVLKETKENQHCNSRRHHRMKTPALPTTTLAIFMEMVNAILSNYWQNPLVRG